MKPDKENTVTRSKGNVFADLGLADADDLLAKANLALHIRRAINARKLTQAKAGKLLGIDQPRVSSIINGHVEGFSTDRLMRLPVRRQTGLLKQPRRSVEAICSGDPRQSPRPLHGGAVCDWQAVSSPQIKKRSKCEHRTLNIQHPTSNIQVNS